jgi:hypothetical protein
MKLTKIALAVLLASGLAACNVSTQIKHIQMCMFLA